MIDMCVFTVGKSRYAIPVWSVEEIFRPVGITSVPGSDKRVAGIINLRGSSGCSASTCAVVCLPVKKKKLPTKIKQPDDSPRIV